MLILRHIFIFSVFTWLLINLQMPDTEGILKTNFCTLIVMILFPLGFHSTDFEKIVFIESNPHVSLFRCSGYSSSHNSFLVVFVRVKVHLFKKQEEPFLRFLPSTVCARVTVADLGKDLPELISLTTVKRTKHNLLQKCSCIIFSLPLPQIFKIPLYLNLRVSHCPSARHALLIH